MYGPASEIMDVSITIGAKSKWRGFAISDCLVVGSEGTAR